MKMQQTCNKTATIVYLILYKKNACVNTQAFVFNNINIIS